LHGSRPDTQNPEHTGGAVMTALAVIYFGAGKTRIANVSFPCASQLTPPGVCCETNKELARNDSEPTPNSRLTAILSSPACVGVAVMWKASFPSASLWAMVAVVPLVAAILSLPSRVPFL